MSGSVGVLEFWQTGNLAREPTENYLLDRVNVGALACGQVKSGEDAFSVLQDMNANRGLSLAVRGGGCVGRN